MKRFIITMLFTLGAGTAMPSLALTLADHIGELAAPDAAARTLEVSPDTRHLNVNSGDVVRLEFNGETRTWRFNGIDAVINLRQIIPGAPDVNVYVARANNRYAP
jgi:Heavy-metal resistance protein CzcE